MIKTFSC
jgi:tetratricopeptide (TPR) repeat protein